MYDIPTPEALDAHRFGGNRDSMGFAAGKDVADRLLRELEETCTYARALWQQLDEVRHYLVDSLPRPAANGAPLGGAAPTGRDDEQGWQAWTDIYTAVVGTLEGPRRDSGFGHDEARQIVRSRLEFAADQQPTLETIERP
jgi:hypothetical protein